MRIGACRSGSPRNRGASSSCGRTAPNAPPSARRPTAPLDRQDVQPEQHRPEPVLFAHMVASRCRSSPRRKSSPGRHPSGCRRTSSRSAFRNAAMPIASATRSTAARGRHRARHALQPRRIARRQMRIGRQNRQAVRGRDIDAAPEDHVAVAVAVRCGAEIGTVRRHHRRPSARAPRSGSGRDACRRNRAAACRWTTVPGAAPSRRSRISTA